MHKFILTTIIAIGAINLGLYAQEKDTAQAEPKIELKVIYEKTFDEPIVDVIFDTATVSIEEAKKMGWKEEAFTSADKSKSKVLVSYPKVVFVSLGDVKELRFYNKNSSIMRRLALKKYEETVYFSPQKKYVLVSRIPTEWNPDYSGGTLYDLDGQKIWEIDGPTPIAVSDEGYAIAAHLDWQVPPEPGGDFYVYDSKGKLLTSIENPNKRKTSPLFAEYSKDGEYAILSFKACTYPPTVFVLITKKGMILWEKELAEYRFRGVSTEIDIKHNKGVLGVIDPGGKKGFFLDWNGNLRWVIPLNTYGTFYCLFASDTERVYICTEVGYLWCFNEKTGERIWIHKEDWSPPLGDLKYSSLGKGPKFTEMYEESQNIVIKGHPSTIFLFNSKIGKLKAKIGYPDTKIFLSPHNGNIFVIDVDNKRIQGLKIEEE